MVSFFLWFAVLSRGLIKKYYEQRNDILSQEVIIHPSDL